MNSSDFNESLLSNAHKRFNQYSTDVQEKMKNIKQEDLAKKLQIRYFKYFKHWRDYDLLTCILAMIGLILAVVEYEYHFDYHNRSVQEAIDNSFVRVIITITSVLAIISLFFRYWLYTFWMDFKNSKELQNQYIQIQNDILKEEEAMSSPTKVDDEQTIAQRKQRKKKIHKQSQFQKYLTLLFSWEFFFEFIVLAIHPFPYVEREYTFKIINMLGAKDQLVDVNYTLGDFLFAFMFFRFYFLIRTLMNFSVYSELYSKRICSKFKFEADTSFCIKALITKSPGSTILLTSIISIMWLSYLLRIFERIYYQSQGQIVFDSYITSVWCVIITMTTVGYGDVYAVSPFGRVISILNALWGAFIISMLVASIGRIFELNDNQKKAICEITNSKRAASSIKAGIQLFNAVKDHNRYKHVPHEERVDYVPTQEDIAKLKSKMEKETEMYKEERNANNDLNPGIDQSVIDVEVIKEQIIDLNDKFDFLINILLKNNKMGVQKKEHNLEFVLGDGQVSINQERIDDDQEILNYVKDFEMKARLTTGKDRETLRKKAPKMPLSKRIEEAKRQEELQETKKTR